MLYQSLLDKIFADNAAKVSRREDFKQIVSTYPYFGLAHFFLLQEEISRLGKNGKGIVTFFPGSANPALLQFQLTRKDKKAVIQIVPKEVAVVSTDREPNPAQLDQEAEIIFEPLHTTDYFASQGIKISDEVQPTDKLGTQLKSFTEWLKTMKKVHESKLPEGSDQLDATVNKLAEKSNRDAEVVTEAMAEAFLVQGKKDKAKDIYQKLSLLNPSKTAYFAAKLEQIK